MAGDESAAFKQLAKELDAIAKVMKDRGEAVNRDVPKSWWAADNWRCVNGHVNTSDDLCPCRERVHLTFPGDRSGPLDPVRNYRGYSPYAKSYVKSTSLSSMVGKTISVSGGGLTTMHTSALTATEAFRTLSAAILPNDIAELERMVIDRWDNQWHIECYHSADPDEPPVIEWGIGSGSDYEEGREPSLTAALKAMLDPELEGGNPLPVSTSDDDVTVADNDGRVVLDLGGIEIRLPLGVCFDWAIVEKFEAAVRELQQDDLL